MFKTIVVGLDGSEGAKRTLPLATQLAESDDAKLVLAHIEEGMIGGVPIRADEDGIRAEIKGQAEELTSRGIETSVETASILAGGPARVIAEIADKTHADLIIVGSRGHSAVAGVILGSVAQRLLHMAHQPVMVVPEDARLPGSSAG